MIRARLQRDPRFSPHISSAASSVSVVQLAAQARGEVASLCDDTCACEQIDESVQVARGEKRKLPHGQYSIGHGQ